MVRSKIKNFAQFTVHKNTKETGYPCPPYKIIILDEADSMTRDAQTALRRTMEKYSNITRFCLICNYVSRIIAPVASRCSKFRFESLNKESMYNKLIEISKNENISISDDVINEIILISDGDMRKSITLLQSASLMKSGKDDKITLNDVYTVTVRIPDNLISNNIINACLSSSFNEINNTAQYIISEGYPISNILPKLLSFIMISDEYFTNLSKADIALKIAECDKKLVDGASELLQLLDILGVIQKEIKRPNTNTNNNNKNN